MRLRMSTAESALKRVGVASKRVKTRSITPAWVLRLTEPWSFVTAMHAVFSDRREAGRLLAARLKALAPEHPVVLALPRGGVPVAYEIAVALNAPLDVLLVRKLGAPGYEEFAIGAVMDGEHPHTVLNAEAIAELQVPPAYVAQECDRQLAEIERRRALYRGDQRPVSLLGRTAILVDDGIATGSTVRVALQGLAKSGAARVILAVPVAPPDTLSALADEADEIVCLQAPADFRAVGQFYEDFSQTSDEEVIALLAERRAARRPTTAGERLMSEPFRAKAYVLEGCPFSCKFLIFMAEAGLLNEIEIVRCDPNSPRFEEEKYRLTTWLGRNATFPVVELEPGKYRADSDALIEHYAKRHGIDSKSLPVLAFYKQTILPQLEELHRQTSSGNR
jgi:putative phosphoribosyl transferase